MFPPSQPGADELPKSNPRAAELPRPAWSRRASSIGAWSSPRVPTISASSCRLEVSKFPRNPGPAPDPHCTKLDGPSIKPRIHIRARRYILLTLGCSIVHSEPSMSPAARVQVMQKPYRARFLTQRRARGLELDISIADLPPSKPWAAELPPTDQE